MSYSITVKPSGHQFTAEADETVLEAALRQGLSFPYGCRNGACGACVGTVLEGQVSYEEPPMGLDDDEIEAGKALFCSAQAQSDLVIEVHEVTSSRDIAIKNLPAKVFELNKLNDDVMQVFIKLPEAERLQYLAGQYLDILLPDGRRRSFSIANAPHDDTYIELHIRHIVGGEFTDHVFRDMHAQELLRIEGPHGSFFLREDSDRAILLLATGTGFGPVKAIVEHAIAEGLQRPIYIYWGARDKAGLYMDELVSRWDYEYAHIHYRPVLSQPKPEDQWQGRTGHVQDAVQADFNDLRDFELYACGHPAMVYSAKDALVALGIAPEHCYSDAFEWAKDAKK